MLYPANPCCSLHRLRVFFTQNMGSGQSCLHWGGEGNLSLTKTKQSVTRKGHFFLPQQSCSDTLVCTRWVDQTDLRAGTGLIVTGCCGVNINKSPSHSQRHLNLDNKSHSYLIPLYYRLSSGC